MNEELQAYARNYIKEALSQCTEREHEIFKLMYSHLNLDKPINQVVDDMPYEQLDWAMKQMDNTLKLHKEKVHEDPS